MEKCGEAIATAQQRGRETLPKRDFGDKSWRDESKQTHAGLSKADSDIVVDKTFALRVFLKEYSPKSIPIICHS